jgi:hypothetical protein
MRTKLRRRVILEALAAVVFTLAVPFAIYKDTGPAAVIVLVAAVVALLKPKVRFLFWPKLK